MGRPWSKAGLPEIASIRTTANEYTSIRWLVLKYSGSIYITKSTLHSSGYIWLSSRKEDPFFEMPKSCYFGHKILIQENVVSFYISMDYAFRSVSAEIVKPSSSSHANFKSLLPGEWWLTMFIEPFAQRTIGHILIHQNHLLPFMAIANKRHNMEVLEFG